MSVFLWFVLIVFVGYNVVTLMGEVSTARRRFKERRAIERFKRARQ